MLGSVWMQIKGFAKYCFKGQLTSVYKAVGDIFICNESVLGIQFKQSEKFQAKKKHLGKMSEYFRKNLGNKCFLLWLYPV